MMKPAIVRGNRGKVPHCAFPKQYSGTFLGGHLQVRKPVSKVTPGCLSSQGISWIFRSIREMTAKSFIYNSYTPFVRSTKSSFQGVFPRSKRARVMGR